MSRRLLLGHLGDLTVQVFQLCKDGLLALEGHAGEVFALDLQRPARLLLYLGHPRSELLGLLLEADLRRGHLDEPLPGLAQQFLLLDIGVVHDLAWVLRAVQGGADLDFEET